MKKFVRQTSWYINGAPSESDGGSGVIDFGECGWLAFFGNVQSGMFESKEDAEMGLLKMMLSPGRGYEEGY